MKCKSYRMDVARGLEAGQVGVDREKETIRGFAVVTKGPVESHEIEFDGEALDAVVSLGNRAKGVKARFGHPNMSSTALGTFLGTAHNFRREGDLVRADLRLSETSHKTPRGDLGQYVLELADKHPDHFGSSMVVSGELIGRLDEKGRRKKNEKGEEMFPLFRPTKLRATDIVDQPAANEGLFAGESFFEADVELSAEATKFLDKFLEDDDAVWKALGFLQRYLASRLSEEETEPPLKEEPKMGDQAAVPAVTVNQALSEAERKTIRDAAIAEERGRQKHIFDAAFPGQEDIAKEAIEKGLSVEEAKDRFIADMKSKLGKRAASLELDHAKGLLPSAPPTDEKPKVKTNEPPIVEGNFDEKMAKDQWAAMDSKARSEFFGDEKCYLSYWKAAAQDRFKPIQEKVQALI